MHGFNSPIRYVFWDDRSRDLAKRTALSMIADVGSGDVARVRSEFVLHARKRLSDREIAAQTPEWCAIKAIDSAGGGLPW